PPRRTIARLARTRLELVAHILVGDAAREVGAPTPMEAPPRQRRTERVAWLGAIGDTGAVLGPELASPRREPAGGSVQDIDRARGPHPVYLLSPDAHG